MMETNFDDLLQQGELILQWIKSAEIDITFVEEIYENKQAADSDGLPLKASTV